MHTVLIAIAMLQTPSLSKDAFDLKELHRLEPHSAI